MVENSLDTNIYVYCNNDPVNNCDAFGNFSLRGALKKLSNYVSISWTGVSIKLSREFTVIIGLISLIYRINAIKCDVKSIYNLLKKDYLSTIIVTALPYTSIQLTGEITAWLCNAGAVVAMMSVIFTFLSICCTGPISITIKTIISLIIAYRFPREELDEFHNYHKVYKMIVVTIVYDFIIARVVVIIRYFIRGNDVDSNPEGIFAAIIITLVFGIPCLFTEIRYIIKSKQYSGQFFYAFPINKRAAKLIGDSEMKDHKCNTCPFGISLFIKFMLLITICNFIWEDYVK